MKLKLEQYNNDIKALEIKAKSANLDIKDEYHKKIATLKQHRDEGNLKMEELIGSTDSKWQELKNGFETVWDKMSRSIGSVKDKITDKEHS
jgi:DNA-binding protein H-NS